MKDPPVVGSGSGQPLKGVSSSLTARRFHGDDALGDSNLSEPKLKAATDDGIGLIISELDFGRADTIIATGPLTNLARALLRDPEITKKIKEVYIMGGAVFVDGNITPHAEFNFHCDPEAADLVLTSGLPITLVSLDVTHKVNVTQEHLEPLRKYKNRLGEFVVGIIEYSIDVHRRLRGAAGAHLHDPLTVAMAVSPQLGEYEQLSLRVDCAEKRGMVHIVEGVKNVRFVKDVDVADFLKLFINRIGGQIEAIEDL